MVVPFTAQLHFPEKFGRSLCLCRSEPSQRLLAWVPQPQGDPLINVSHRQLSGRLSTRLSRITPDKSACDRLMWSWPPVAIYRLIPVARSPSHQQTPVKSALHRRSGSGASAANSLRAPGAREVAIWEAWSVRNGKGSRQQGSLNPTITIHAHHHRSCDAGRLR